MRGMGFLKVHCRDLFPISFPDASVRGRSFFLPLGTVAVGVFFLLSEWDQEFWNVCDPFVPQRWEWGRLTFSLVASCSILAGKLGGLWLWCCFFFLLFVPPLYRGKFFFSVAGRTGD